MIWQQISLTNRLTHQSTTPPPSLTSGGNDELEPNTADVRLDNHLGNRRMGPLGKEEWQWRLHDIPFKIESGEPWYMWNWMFHMAIFAWPGVLLDHPPILCCLLPGDRWYAITWCTWDNLWKGCNYWKSWGRHQVYRLRDVCLMIVRVLSDLTWLPLLGGRRKSWFIIIIFIKIY